MLEFQCWSMHIRAVCTQCRSDNRHTVHNAIMSFYGMLLPPIPLPTCTVMLKLCITVAVMALLSPGMSRAQTPIPVNAAPVYAILSLIGDRLDIVATQTQTGAKPDSNLRHSVAINEPVFDDTAVSAAGRAIVKHNSRAEVAALNTRSAVLFEKHRELFRLNEGVLSIPDAIKSAIAAQKATHFILITKYNDEAQLKYLNGTEGVGRLEGLGFYLDVFNQRPVIVPYAYMKLVLVDMASRRVLNTRLIRASIAMRERVPTADGTSSVQAWETLTSAEKVQVIDQLIRDEITQVMPDFIQGK
jgi:hypothetical protein